MFPRLMLLFVTGVAAGLGQVPFALPLVSLFAFLFAFVIAALLSDWRSAFWSGWAFGTGYFALTLHWIVEPFLVDIARHGWMAPFALVLLASGLALFWGAAFAIARRITRRPLPFALAWSGLIAIVELTRGYILTGFPWALIGYIWIETPFLSLVAIVGPYGLTLLTVLIPALLGAILVRGNWRTTGAAALAGLASVALAAVAWPGDANPTQQIGPIVRLIQPNVAQHEKWDPDKVNEFFHRQLRFTNSPADVRPDLIIWSETAIPWRLGRAEVAIDMISQAAAGIPVALGVLRVDGVRAFNSLAVLDETGEVREVYDKHHLVPFGEYIPFGAIAQAVGLRSFAAQDGYGYSPGPGPRLLDFGPLGSALPLICYEAIFPQNIRAAPTRPNWLLQVTNDAWFGQIAGPQQHLAQARVRAVEQGLPLVRAANTGISAVIDGRGRVIASIPLGEAGFVDAVLPPALPPTIYAKTGDSAALAFSLLLILTAGVVTRRNSD